MSQVQLMSGVAFDVASFEATGVADPVIRMHGELPASSQPLSLHRVYKGPQGVYEEVVALAAPDGTVLWSSQPRLIELRGMMFEDLFRSLLDERVPITSVEEHTVLFYLDGNMVGRVPVFVDAPESGEAAGVVMEAATTALKKGAICWLRIPQQDGTTQTRPAWYVQQGEKLFVLKGPEEQELPGLEHATDVEVVVRSKEVRATIAELGAKVRVVDDAEEFERIAILGLGTRLNLQDGQDALQRWKDTCTIVELTLTA